MRAMKLFKKLSAHLLAWIYIITLVVFAVVPYFLYLRSIGHIIAFGLVSIVLFVGLLFKILRPSLITEVFQKYLFFLIGVYFAIAIPLIKNQTAVSVYPRMVVQFEWAKSDDPLAENPIYSKYLYVTSEEAMPETTVLPIVVRNLGNEMARNAIVSVLISLANFEFVRCNHMKIVDTLNMDFVAQNKSLICRGNEPYLVLSYRFIDPVLVHTSVFADSIVLVTRRPFLFHSRFKADPNWDYAIIRTETNYDKTMNTDKQYGLLWVVSAKATADQRDFITKELLIMNHAIAEGTHKIYPSDDFFR